MAHSKAWSIGALLRVSRHEISWMLYEFHRGSIVSYTLCMSLTLTTRVKSQQQKWCICCLWFLCDLLLSPLGISGLAAALGASVYSRSGSFALTTRPRMFSARLLGMAREIEHWETRFVIQDSSTGYICLWHNDNDRSALISFSYFQHDCIVRHVACVLSVCLLLEMSHRIVACRCVPTCLVEGPAIHSLIPQ